MACFFDGLRSPRSKTLRCLGWTSLNQRQEADEGDVQRPIQRVGLGVAMIADLGKEHLKKRQSLGGKVEMRIWMTSDCWFGQSQKKSLQKRSSIGIKHGKRKSEQYH